MGTLWQAVGLLGYELGRPEFRRGIPLKIYQIFCQTSRRLLWVAYGFLLVAIPAVHAADQGFDDVSLHELPPELEAQGWRLLARAEIAATEFQLVTSVAAESDLLRIDANQSNALMFRPLSAQEQSAKQLTWSWRVDQGPPVTSLRQATMDDRPLAIYVGFSVESKHLGLWTRLKRTLVARVSGLPKGQIMTYVWGGNDPRDSHFDNPYIPHISRVKILRDGHQPTETWFEERIDLLADFSAVFGYPAVRPTFIAISADTEDTKSHSIAWVKNVRFESSPVREAAVETGN